MANIEKSVVFLEKAAARDKVFKFFQSFSKVLAHYLKLSSIFKDSSILFPLSALESSLGSTRSILRITNVINTYFSIQKSFPIRDVVSRHLSVFRYIAALLYWYPDTLQTFSKIGVVKYDAKRLAWWANFFQFFVLTSALINSIYQLVAGILEFTALKERSNMLKESKNLLKKKLEVKERLLLENHSDVNSSRLKEKVGTYQNKLTGMDLTTTKYDTDCFRIVASRKNLIRASIRFILDLIPVINVLFSKGWSVPVTGIPATITSAMTMYDLWPAK